MSRLISIDMSYIIVSVIEVKSKYLMEDFVKISELNFIKSILNDYLRKKNMYINSKIDNDYFFVYGGVIFLNYNNNITLSTVSKKFEQLYIYDDFWSEEFICRKLLELKKKECKNFEKSIVSLNSFSDDTKILVSMFDITLLVSKLDSLKLEKCVEKELMVAYYEGHYKGKLNGFVDNFVVVSDKPNLLSYLIEQGIVSNGNVLERDDKLVKIRRKLVV